MPKRAAASKGSPPKRALTEVNEATVQPASTTDPRATVAPSSSVIPASPSELHEEDVQDMLRMWSERVGHGTAALDAVFPFVKKAAPRPPRPPPPPKKVLGADPDPSKWPVMRSVSNPANPLHRHIDGLYGNLHPRIQQEMRRLFRF